MSDVAYHKTWFLSEQGRTQWMKVNEQQDGVALCHDMWPYRYCSDAYMVESVISSRVTWRYNSKKRTKQSHMSKTISLNLKTQGFKSLIWPTVYPTKPFTHHCQGHLGLETLRLKSCSRDFALKRIGISVTQENNKRPMFTFIKGAGMPDHGVVFRPLTFREILIYLCIYITFKILHALPLSTEMKAMDVWTVSVSLSLTYSNNVYICNLAPRTQTLKQDKTNCKF